MASGDPVERAMERSARALFPKLAKASLPDTEFGVLVLPSFSSPHVVLFRDSNGETLVEKREIDSEIFLRDLTPDERPRITTSSKALPPRLPPHPSPRFGGLWRMRVPITRANGG